MDEFYNKYYIRTREDGCIVDGGRHPFQRDRDLPIPAGTQR